MLNNKKLINYLIVRENNVNSYLKNFDITKDDFNSLFINNKDELIRYYDEAYNRAVTKVMDDEYVVITFDNLDRINEFLNEDGKITASDYVIIKDYIMGDTQLSDTQKIKADYNGDGKVTASDYVLIKDKLMGD